MSEHCEGCVWWDDFTWACCNGDSPHCADFVNCGCEFFERKEDVECRSEKEQKL